MVEDGVCGAVILLQLNDFYLGIVFFHFEQVRDLRAPPAIDALIVIADDAEVPDVPGSARERG